ncbi:MAG TPA: phosphotransferase [Acidimicrobiales bacterium]|nr:phosphotransferase [Acidimicrobiales bacterium]
MWCLDGLHLRICWRGDRARLEKEAMVAAHLPSEIPYPPVVATGSTEDLSWMVTAAVPGQTLWAIWPALSAIERESAVAQLTDSLRALHDWQVPAPLLDRLLTDQTRRHPDAEAVIGAEIFPVQGSRLSVLVDALAEMPFTDGLVAPLRGRLEQLLLLGPHEAGEMHRVVHGDASLRNVLWHDGKLSALMDMEWVRLGAPDMEFPFLAAQPPGATGLSVAQLVARAYPELFSHPYMEGRLWLYEIAHHLRMTIIWPPQNRSEAASPDGTLETLRSLVSDVPPSIAELIRVARS